MGALWCGCVLGLLCIPVSQGMANTVTVTQTPSSITELKLNSSVNITCSTTVHHMLHHSKEVLTLDLKRHFGQENVAFLVLQNGEISKKTIVRYKQRMEVELDKPGVTSFRVNFTISRLQVHDTDLYLCRWDYLSAEMTETISTNGSLIIVNDRLPEMPRVECGDDFFLTDITLIALSVVSIPFVICFLIFTVIVLCKRFQKKFTPSRPANNLAQTRPHHICTPPHNHSYYYLNTSVTGCSQV